MRTMPRFGLIAAAAVTAAAVFAACHHAPDVAPAPDPVADLARARALVRRGDFSHALVAFRRLTFELGATQPEMAEVQYYLAECYFQTGDRMEAAHDFRQVADQYPTSEFAPLALLRAGDANLRMWRRPELDPSYGETALAIYQELAGRYPGSEAAQRAQAHVRELQEWFAEKDYRNGMFYFRHRAFDSAIIYFKDVIASYPGTAQVPRALMRLVESYRAIGYAEELKETCANLRRYYPTTDGLDKTCPADSSAAAPS
jgi:outer membrane protein assembly factor BamD